MLNIWPFPKKPKKLALDVLQYRLFWREGVLIRMNHLNAPDFLIDRQKDLISKAQKDIGDRIASIRLQAIENRVKLDSILTHD
jgi:hypothetical protein